MGSNRLACLALSLALGAAAACSDTRNVNVPSSPTAPTSPTVPPNAPVAIAFRVQGNATAARIRYSTSADGLTQVVSSLPFQANVTTDGENLFLFMDVTPTAYSFSVLFPFLSAQIVVNGTLFREVNSAEFLLNTLTVSGTWRK